MQITDPIADMLTRIRNANNAKHDTVDVPASNMKKSIAQILLDEGYIKNFQLIDDGTQGVIRISLKYSQPGKEKVISGLRRVSKPGLRVYAGADELPRAWIPGAGRKSPFLCWADCTSGGRGSRPEYRRRSTGSF